MSKSSVGQWAQGGMQAAQAVGTNWRRNGINVVENFS